MCPKPFSWAKNKRKLFSEGKSRGPLLAGAALNLDVAWYEFLRCLSGASCKALGSDVNDSADY